MQGVRRLITIGGAVVCILALLLGMAVGARAEEVVVEQYPDSNYAPGPGWPEGWSPPPPPAEMPEDVRKYYEDYLKQVPQYKRLEMRVLDSLPNWTKEYPYRWDHGFVACGETLYVYYHPVPDTHLISKTYDRTFIFGRWISDICHIYPVRFITEARKQDPEQIASFERMVELKKEMEGSANGLSLRYGDGMEGRPDHVYVFLNGGVASERFDIPAYLDPAIGRVRVPIRFVSELMGARVSWDEVTGRVTIHFPQVSREVLKAVPKEGHGVEDFFWPRQYFPTGDNLLVEKQTVTTPERTIVLTVGRPVAIVDGKEVPIDAPPVVKEGRTMVPIRFVAEQMGCKVYWVGSQPVFEYSDGTRSGTYQVHIYTPFFPLYDYPSWFLENRAVKF